MELMVFQASLFFWHVMRRNFWIVQKNYFISNDFLDLVQLHDATQMRGGQWSVITPTLRNKASIRAHPS